MDRGFNFLPFLFCVRFGRLVVAMRGMKKVRMRSLRWEEMFDSFVCILK